MSLVLVVAGVPAGMTPAIKELAAEKRAGLSVRLAMAAVPAITDGRRRLRRSCVGAGGSGNCSCVSNGS